MLFIYLQPLHSGAGPFSSAFSRDMSLPHPPKSPSFALGPESKPPGQLMLSEEDPLLEYKELTAALSSELCRPLAKQRQDSRYMLLNQQDVLREVVLRINIHLSMRWLQNSLQQAQQFLRSCRLGYSGEGGTKTYIYKETACLTLPNTKGKPCAFLPLCAALQKILMRFECGRFESRASLAC